MNRQQRRARNRKHRATQTRAKTDATETGRRRAAAQWVSRGNALSASGRTADAVAAFRKALAACPESIELHVILGTALKASGDLQAAIAVFENAKTIDSSLPALHNNLGNALMACGRTEAALTSYRSALVLDGGYADAHGNLGLALAEQGDLLGAETACRRAVELEPQRSALHGVLADVLGRAGHLDEAVKVLEGASQSSPDSAELHSQRARSLIKLGDMTAAELAIRHALTVDPSCAKAYFELAAIKRFNAEDEDLRRMEQLARQIDRLVESDRLDLHFALAKAYEDVGRFDDAFHHLERGNRLKRKTLRFDEERQAALFAITESVFDEPMLSALANCGDPSAVPIFVVGMPRSGTTLIEQILSSHPGIHGGGELRHLSDIARSAAAGISDPVEAVARLSKLTPGDCLALGRRYVSQVRVLNTTAERIVDKMPSNFLRLGLISVLLPNARIIHCRRNPADTCLSCYAQLFDRGQSFSYELRDLGRYYRLYRRLMDHWRRVLPGRLLEVDYEDLVSETERETRRLIAYSGLPWDPECLNFHRRRGPVQTASATQVRRPVYGSSVARWRRFEPHLGALLEELATIS